MAESSHIEVEVIVWDGIFINPFGHVSTKITKNGFVYSYSLEGPPGLPPKKVCNTQKFQLLRVHEQGLRDGVGFILNVSQDQAKEIFISMQTRFHAFKEFSCVYKTKEHNCTYAIQAAMKKAGIELYHDISKIPATQVEDKTNLPSYVAAILLKTKNSQGDWLVKDIVEYKKGKNKGELVDVNQEKFHFGIKALHYKSNKEKLTFSLKAIHDDKGWHTDKEPAWGHWGGHYGVNI